MGESIYTFVDDENLSFPPSLESWFDLLDMTDELVHAAGVGQNGAPCVKCHS